MSPPLCLGLHITKCAGTSLITTLRRALTEDEYYFFSSYHQSWLASRPTFADIVERDRLRIVFGHYCHETLIRIFAHRKVFLFTGLRQPLDCAISGYRQVNAVRLQAGRPPLSAGEYLDTHPNPICTEIMRCFPSLNEMAVPLWQRARAALSLFDFIYTTEDFDRHVQTILAVLDLRGCTVASDNVSDRRSIGSDAVAAIEEGCRIIGAGGHAFIGDDILLYEAMLPHAGRPWLRQSIHEQSWAMDRDAFVAGLPPLAEAESVFLARERDYFVHELHEAGRLAALHASLITKRNNVAALLARISDYSS